MQAHRGIHATPGSTSVRTHEAGTALRWGAVVALVVMLASLGWAVKRSEHLGAETNTVTAATWAQAHAADWSWMQAHWPAVTAVRGNMGDPEWMASHLTVAETSWMHDHGASMSWMSDHWDDMAAMHRSMRGSGGMMGVP